jgi:hypothetical protein
MQIPEKILTQINEELKKSSNQEFQAQTKEITQLQNQYETLRTRIKRATELLLDSSLSKPEYDKMIADLQVQRQNVEARLQKLSNRSHELFKSSDSGQKRQIVNLLFPNLQMDGKTLVFTVVKPFDEVIKCAERPVWLHKTGITRTNFQEENVIDHTHCQKNNIISQTPFLLKILSESYFEESITCAFKIENFRERFCV